jgi:diaminopimelate epimerase
MRQRFRKMHGTGNDFLVVDQRKGAQQIPPPDKLKQLSDRRLGIGFDQLMWIGPPRDADSLAYYRVFNADGSEVEQCGNGVRCVAWVISRDAGQNGNFTLGGPAGHVAVRMQDSGLFSVSMGQPIFEPDKIPFIAGRKSTCYELNVGDDILSVSALSMGNPHCVLLVQNVEDADVGRLGPLIEKHERFPQRTNVGFMAIRNRNSIDLRVYERGVGETRACGTGACAAVVAGRTLGKLNENVEVNLRGGKLMVSWRGGSDPVWLSGDAELTFEGTLDL